MHSYALEKIANAIIEATKPSFVTDYLPTIAAIITSLLSVFLGYMISRRLEKVKNEREIHMVFLEELNTFYIGIHELYRQSINYNKLIDASKLIGIENYKYNQEEDYASNISRIKNLNIAISKMPNKDKIESEYDKYEKQINEIATRFQEFNLFIELGELLNKKAMPYSLFIKAKLERKYLAIINELALSTTKNMAGFYLEKYRESVASLIGDLKIEIKKRI